MEGSTFTQLKEPIGRWPVTSAVIMQFIGGGVEYRMDNNKEYEDCEFVFRTAKSDTVQEIYNKLYMGMISGVISEFDAVEYPFYNIIIIRRYINNPGE